MADLRSRIQQTLSGQYSIERELGGGGMSHVFVANEERLGRKVVVKVLSPELAAAISASRFEREIRVAASLQQANIVPLFAAGDVGGLPYYTMPFIEGESLRTRLANGPRPIAEAVSILRDVTRALAYAHEHGVVHRDIKPDNVLLSGHTAVVTDFGIAKAIAASRDARAGDAPAGDSGALTQLGTTVGTPAYMAPEQAAGDPDTDHRADLYAVGCMAYELLTGQPPFTGLAPHRLLVAHMAESPVPVLERRPDTPPELASLVMQCLAKEPDARPASATELLHRLDAVASPSSARAALSPILIGGRPMLLRALAVYAGAFLGVGILARAAIVAIGLPGWVFPGALTIMALGLPVILFTGYTQYVARRAASATPTFTPGGTQSPAAERGTMATLAIRASPHMSWQRTARGGAIALGAFVLLIAAFMIMRALGVGPAGSLLASGKLSASDRVLVAAFETPDGDPSLGPTIAEAVRTNLSQSDALHIVKSSAIAAALQQMQLPDSTRIDLATAREIAQRIGAKAVVSGSLVPAGDGYIVTTRLVAAESGDELASFHESARDAGELIETVDRLTKELRGRIGESLRSVQSAPRLDQVTTASLEALRSYTAGLQANDIAGDPEGAIRHFRDAIQRDSNFAMAYVQMAYSLMTQGGREEYEQARSAIATAYRLRERLPERERYNVEGAYFSNVAYDAGQAITAFRRAVEIDSSNLDAANSLGVILEGVRMYESADSAYRLALREDPLNGTLMMNLANLYSHTGNHTGFDSLVSLLTTNHVPFPTASYVFVDLWARGDFDAAERLAKIQADTAAPLATIGAQHSLAMIAQVRGRLAEAERRLAQRDEAALRIRGDSANPYFHAYEEAWIDGVLRGNGARAMAALDRTLAAFPPASATFQQDQSYWMAYAYAELGEIAKARELLQRYEARLDSTQRYQRYVFLTRLRGVIALHSGRTDSAIVYFRQADYELDGLPTSNCEACTPLFVGLAFDRADRSDSARTYLSRYADRTGTGRMSVDPWYLGPVLYRLGELYEEAGDARRATEYYGRFIDVWENADAELEGRVGDARSLIVEVNRSAR
jgi:tetratricopeptide (TPR) repeat protein/tRNA A-37 threonylcarbamoyl transferase component Bud32